MGVHDPGGGLLASNPYGLLSEGAKAKRKIPSRQSVDLYSATTSTEEEQFLMMEVPNGSTKNNVVKGVIKSFDISFLTEEEIAEGLKEQKVTEVEIIKRKDKDGNLVNSRMAILTFKAAKIPRKVDFGWYPLKVDLYVPCVV